MLYLIFSLLWLPRVLGFPHMIGTWLGFAEELALASAAVLALTSLPSHDAPGLARVARVAFGLCVMVFGLAHLIAIHETAAMVPKWFPPGQNFWAIATGLGHLLAGLAILTGIQAVLASRLLTAMLLTFGALVWLPLLFAQPTGHTMWAGNAINLAIAGAAWAIADALSNSSKHNTL